MKNFAPSVNDFLIHLPDERWNRIVENHNDMAGYYYEVLETIASPTKKGENMNSIHFLYINVS